MRDLLTGGIGRVSIATDGTQANDNSWLPGINADGRFVWFHTQSSTLVAGDTNGLFDVFLRDRVTGRTERVSIANDGTEGNGNSWTGAVSADGRFAAFESGASNLVVDDTNAIQDVFVRDRGAPPRLILAGACPGNVSLSLTDASPNGPVVFGWGTSEGSFTLPLGPCAGAAIGLADPKPQNGPVLTADQAGEISLNGNVDATACGLLLQAIDVTTCTPSNVASVP